MSTQYYYQYPPSSTPAAGTYTPSHQGVIQAHKPDDHHLTNSMASMSITGGTDQPSRQPLTHGPSHEPFASPAPVYPPHQTQQYYPAPVAQTNSYGIVDTQPYYVPPTPYQTTNLATPSHINTLPQYPQSGYSLTPKIANPVTTISTQPTPNSVHSIPTIAPTGTPLSVVPSMGLPPSNQSMQYPHYNAVGSGAPSSQYGEPYVHTGIEQVQPTTEPTAKGKGL